MYSLIELSKLLNGTLSGDIKEVRGLAPFNLATEEDLTFAADEKFLKKLNETRAKVVLVPDIEGLPDGKTYIKVKGSPRELMPIMLNFFKRKVKKMEKLIEDSSKIGEKTFVSHNSYIGHDVEIGENGYIYPNVTILEGVKIGKNALIYPGVTIREFVTIGDNVIIQPNAVIGSDGFGFVKVNGENVKIEQIGSVVIEDNVEIGACAAIDRGTIGDTIIKRGNKLDNLIHIAHNVIIGEQGFLTAQTGIAGSTVVGKNLVLGGQSGISGHLTVGDNVTVGAKSAVVSNTKGDQIISGYPAIDHKQEIKNKLALKKLPELIKRVKKLESLLK